MAGMISFPCFNADAEQRFSVLRKIHTDQRSNLDQSELTIVSPMSIKFNCLGCCYGARLSEELLTKSVKESYMFSFVIIIFEGAPF